METIKVDIKDIKAAYPESGYPCLEYCKKLIADGANKNSRLEIWNYTREKPEADWTVENIGKYAKKQLPRERFDKWHQGSDLEGVF